MPYHRTDHRSEVRDYRDRRSLGCSDAVNEEFGIEGSGLPHRFILSARKPEQTEEIRGSK